MMSRTVRSIAFMMLFMVLGGGCGGEDPEGDAASDADISSDADVTSDADQSGDADSEGDTSADADEDADEAQVDADPPPDPVITREDGWLRGDLHQHTRWSDGDDGVGTVVRIAEYLTNPEFTAAHPEYEGNGIDFMAITDHRTIDALDDPEFISDDILLIPGEEFGTNGHAGCWGISELVWHDPDGDGVTLEDIEAAIVSTHEQGGLFSPNHPFIMGIPFPWDVRDIDGVEIWNAPWALMALALAEEELLLWESENGPASPLFWRAIQDQGRGKGMQALTWYEALLSRDVHPAIVGGSDRHTILMMAFPTTYVHVESADVDGVLQGIRERHTFVTRNPVSAQLVMEVVQGEERWMMGDVVPIPADGADVTISVLVGRANGGLLQIIAGEHVETDEAIATAPLGEVFLTEDLDEDREVIETTLSVHPGDWVYPMVFEPLYRPGLTSEQIARVDELTVSSLATGGEDFGALAALLVNVIDIGIVLGIDECLIEEWNPDLPQCLPADDNNMATIFIPDYLDRAINVVSDGGEPTEWTMGAVGSAVIFVEE